MGQREWPLNLLAFTVNHPSTDHETKNKAQTRLTNNYQKKVSSQLFSSATAKGKASDLNSLTTDLLSQLSLPLTPPSEEAPLKTEPAHDLIDPLTPRETDVLNLLCEGRTNQEIADELVLAIGTVKFYTGQIYRKLGVRNRVTAVVRARELNLIDNE
jgi:DNA-binding NarL/FixJ family response regulator